MLRKCLAAAVLVAGVAAPVFIGALHSSGTSAAQRAAKPCIALGKLGGQSVLALLNIGVQDIPILTSQDQQQCIVNATVDEIPVLSVNGTANG